MTVQITIRSVPEEVRDQLAIRAAQQHQSMQEYLLSELERIASRPSVSTWLDQVRRRKDAADSRVPSEAILQARETDRK